MASAAPPRLRPLVRDAKGGKGRANANDRQGISPKEGKFYFRTRLRPPRKRTANEPNPARGKKQRQQKQRNDNRELHELREFLMRRRNGDNGVTTTEGGNRNNGGGAKRRGGSRPISFRSGDAARDGVAFGGRAPTAAKAGSRPSGGARPRQRDEGHFDARGCLARRESGWTTTGRPPPLRPATVEEAGKREIEAGAEAVSIAFPCVFRYRDDMSRVRRIYLDHAATTPLAPEVLAAMTPFLTGTFGNPSSLHLAGREARIAVEAARERVAEALGAKPSELVFTSGGTEGDALAVLGGGRRRTEEGRGRREEGRKKQRKKETTETTKTTETTETEDGRPHVVTSAIEHHAVLHACAQLEREGFDVSRVPPGPDGTVRAASVVRAIRPETVLVSVMHSNNETGAVQPVAEIGRAIRRCVSTVPALRPSPSPPPLGGRGATTRDALFHIDMVQSLGKIPVLVSVLGCDLVTISAHKINGPKGVGALYIREGTAIEPLQFGGGSEFGLRPGTENVAGIVGLAAAVERVLSRMQETVPVVSALRDRLEAGLRERIPDLRVNGADAPRVCNILNCTIPGVDGEALILRLDARGVAASTGAACSAGDTEPSHVLLAMGLSRELARASLRFSLGPENTMEEIETAIRIVEEEVGRLRGIPEPSDGRIV